MVEYGNCDTRINVGRDAYNHREHRYAKEATYTRLACCGDTSLTCEVRSSNRCTDVRQPSREAERDVWLRYSMSD